MKYASVGQRLIAHFVDYLTGLGLSFWFLLSVTRSTSPEELLNSALGYIIYAVWYWILYTLVQALLISRFGGSLGKLITGLAVKDSKGNNISFWRAVFRENITKMLSVYLFGLGFWWMLKDKNKQTWHDMMSDTFVVVQRPLNTIVGAVAIGLLLVGNVLLFKQNVKSLLENKPMYMELINDAVTSFKQYTTKKIMPSTKLPSPVPSPALKYQYKTN